MKAILLLFFCSMFYGIGSGVDGSWKTTMNGPDGDMEMTFVFAMEGGKLTGFVKSPMGELPISNTKIDGTVFSFDVAVNGMVIKHDCVLKDGIINMKVSGGPMGDTDHILKRQ